jgi:hypothetical protein
MEHLHLLPRKVQAAAIDIFRLPYNSMTTTICLFRNRHLLYTTVSSAQFVLKMTPHSKFPDSCEPTDEGTPTPTRVAFGDSESNRPVVQHDANSRLDNISILPAEFFDRIHATNSTIEHAAEVITDNINVAFGVAY